MATISAPNLVLLRTQQQAASFYLSTLKPVALLTAVVTGTPIRGARSLSYTSGTGSGFSTIEAGQLVEITTSKGTKWVRLNSVISGNQSAGVLGLDENAIAATNGDVVIVKHFYPMVAAPPSIRSQIFYKFYDIVFSTQNSTPNPVAIIGSHRAGRLTGASLVFAFTASSYAIAQGATISSHAWSCVHNGGGTTGITISAATSATTNITFTTADTYWVKYTVTDSNGKTQSTYRAVFVETSPYKDFTISSFGADWQQGGWRFNAEVTGAVTLADFPDRTLVVLWQENSFNGVEGYVDLWGTASQNIVCAGYLRHDNDNDDFSDGTGRISFDVTTPESVMDSMNELGTISINAVTSPATWYQYASWLTVGRGIHHLLKWHSTVLETCDVYGLTTNTLGVRNLDFTEPSLLQMVNSLAYTRGIFAKLVSNRLGQLRLDTDSQMLNDAGRAALDTVYTLAISDISGTVGVVRAPEESVATSDLDGFSFNGTTGTPFISIAPGYRESSISYGFPEFRGTGSISTKGQVLIDQTDSNEKAGRVLAAANNNPRELRFALPYGALGAFDIMPSIGWYVWGISNASLKRQTELFNKKFVCRSISHAINHQTGTIETSVVLEREAIGPDGIQGNYPVGYPTPVLRIPDWIAPIVHFTTTYAYFAGGFNGSAYVVTADRMTFLTGNTAAYATGNLTQNRAFHGALSDTQEFGYHAGGQLTFGSAVETDTTERVTLITGVAAAHTALLSTAKCCFFGLSDGNVNGYFPGGITTGIGLLDDTDRVSFASGTISASPASNLSSPRSEAPCLSGSVYGYTGGGEDGGGVTVDGDQITFVTGVMAANGPGDLSVARQNAAPISDTVTYGYFAGGEIAGAAFTQVTDRINLATGIAAAYPTGNLTAAIVPRVASSDGALFGYVITTNASTSNKLTFSTGVMSNNGGSDLSDNRTSLGGFSDGVA